MASPPSTFERLVTSRRRTLDLLQGVAQETSERRPTKCKLLLGEAGKWSIGEIADHILRVYYSLVGEIENLYDLDASGQTPRIVRTIKEYDVAPALVPKPLMAVLAPGFQVANFVADSIFPASTREKILRNRLVPIQNPKRWLPVAGRDISELRSELESTLPELESLLQRDTQNPLEKMILSHSVYGSNAVPDLVGILEVHESWHHKDLEALIAG